MFCFINMHMYLSAPLSARLRPLTPGASTLRALGFFAHKGSVTVHWWRFRAGYLFGGDVVAQFNSTNAIELSARAHQLGMEGYKHMFSDTLVTVWSAPNYCYRCGNVAAILELDEHLSKNFKIFEAAPQEVCACLSRSFGSPSPMSP